MIVFIDACCFFSAFRSPTGGSALILQIARAGKIKLATNETVILEAYRNLKQKQSPELAKEFLQYLKETGVMIILPPTPEEEKVWKEKTHAKDVHVLAGAIAVDADYLVTLDRKHLLKPDLQKVFPIPILDTGKFLKAFLEK